MADLTDEQLQPRLCVLGRQSVKLGGLFGRSEDGFVVERVIVFPVGGVMVDISRAEGSVDDLFSLTSVGMSYCTLIERNEAED